MSQASTAGGPNRDYDAFISYSSADRRVARALQIFLESYRVKKSRSRVKVYLDQTDIRGGELGEEIHEALRRSRKLLVCLSRSASESRWVAHEVEWFGREHDRADIALAVLDTNVDPALAFVSGSEFRRHDLASPRPFGFWRPRVRLELLRLLAFITEVDLRELRNWHLRRRLRNICIGTAVGVLPLLALGLYPVDDWQRFEIRARDQPLYALSAGVEGNELVAASRFRAPGPQGFRNYIRYTRHRGDENADEDFSGVSPLRNRVLPLSLRDYSVRARLPTIDAAALGDRQTVGEPFVSEVNPSKMVVLISLLPTEAELQEATDAAADFGTPIPTTSGTLVVVREGKNQNSVIVPDLNVTWAEHGQEGPTSPAKAPSLAWSNGGQIFLGVPGWDAQTEGGLWFSADAGGSWRKVEDFAGVSSVATLEEGGRTRVFVAEAHFDGWRGGMLVPFPTRVSELSDGSVRTDARSLPPFGSRSEVEFCGFIDGTQVIRVDERIYLRRSIALFRRLARSQ